MTDAEDALRRRVEAGDAVVANLRLHRELVAWAKQLGLFARVDRRSPFGNPFLLGRDGDRDAVCDAFATYLPTRPDLVRRLPELRGKLLGCWCAPARCHADTLAQLANALSGDRESDPTPASRLASSGV